MIRNIVFTVLLAIIAGILQSTLIGRIALFNVVPDLALCILVYSAYVNGTMTGQISGFFSGLLRDLISSPPLGLNSLIRTLIGAITGIFKGALFLDYFFMPVFLCAAATIIKAVFYLFLRLFLGQAIPFYSFTTSLFWIEVGLNALSAPLLFLILRQIKYISPKRR